MPLVWCTDPTRLSVGLQSGKTDIIRGKKSGDGTTWDIEVSVRTGKNGDLDFGGPLVHGKRGDRFLYLSWGTTDQSHHDMFRRLKLYLVPLTRAGWSQPGISWEQVRTAKPLALAISGRGADGTPHCGTAPAQWK